MTQEAPALTFGEQLRRARDRAEMSQAELAFIVGVSRPTLGKWENDRSEPTIHQFARLVTATGASWLYDIVNESDVGPKITFRPYCKSPGQPLSIAAA